MTANELVAQSERNDARSLKILITLGSIAVLSFIAMVLLPTYGWTLPLVCGVSLVSFMIFIPIDTARMRRDTALIMNALDDELALGIVRSLHTQKDTNEKNQDRTNTQRAS